MCPGSPLFMGLRIPSQKGWLFFFFNQYGEVFIRSRTSRNKKSFLISQISRCYSYRVPHKEILSIQSFPCTLFWCILFFFLFFCFIFFNFYFYFILLYDTVLVLPYIDMNPPRVYMRSQTWTPLPPPSPQHPSGSSPCTSPKHIF